MADQHYILYLEEDHSAAHRICKLLELAGYSVVGVTNDKQGLEMLYRQKPDVLLLDLTQPDSQSWALFKAIKGNKNLAGIPIIDLGIRVPEGGRIVFDEYLPPVPDLDRMVRSVMALAPKSKRFWANGRA